MKNLNKILFNADQICLPYYLYFFFNQLQIFDDEGCQKAKVNSKIHLFSDSFFVFVFVIYNLIPH